MSSADRFAVPLNSMCSMKCERPFSSALSRREPLETQIPTETERTCGIASVITLIPFGRVVVRMSRSLVDVGATEVWAVICLDNNVVNLLHLYHFHPRLRGQWSFRVYNSRLC